MKNIQGCNQSITLIGSLCKEAESTRNRINQIRLTVRNCGNPYLIERLNNELVQLKKRKSEISKIATTIHNICTEKTSILFLIELCSR